MTSLSHVVRKKIRVSFRLTCWRLFVLLGCKSRSKLTSTTNVPWTLRSYSGAFICAFRITKKNKLWSDSDVLTLTLKLLQVPFVKRIHGTNCCSSHQTHRNVSVWVGRLLFPSCYRTPTRPADSGSLWKSLTWQIQAGLKLQTLMTPSPRPPGFTAGC